MTIAGHESILLLTPRSILFMRFIRKLNNQKLEDSLYNLNQLLESTHLHLFFLRAISTYPEYDTWRNEHYVQVLRYIDKYKIKSPAMRSNVVEYFSEAAFKKIKEAQQGALELLRAKLKFSKEHSHILSNPDFGALVSHVNTH